MEAVRDGVRVYYGQVLGKSSDLKTSACCMAEPPSPAVARALGLVPDEVIIRYFGCGNPLPEGVEGLDVLDLGCGSGRDCFVMSKLVGPDGTVTGVDMTEEQLCVPREHCEEFCVEKLGYPACNMRFLTGYIEELTSIDGVSKSSMDLVISNCVVNLTVDKLTVLREVHNVLRSGGEFFFSDMFADRRIPAAFREDQVLYGEGLGGSMYVNDFLRMCRLVGFEDPRLVSSREISLAPEVASKTGNISFFARTYRLFKLDALESSSEDYGQLVTYKGTFSGSPLSYHLDDKHVFETGKPVPVSGNTACILQDSWLSKFFEVTGNKEVHFGCFPS